MIHPEQSNPEVAMSSQVEAVTEQLMALSPGERLEVALAVWVSLSDEDRAAAFPPNAQALADIRRRDRELESGAASPRTHEEVMAAARRALGCG
jgi:hypothetical protein